MKPSAADFAYAKQAGLMFDPLELSHDEAVRWLIKARDALRIRQVSDAFLASLTTRRIEWRTAFASYAVVRHLPKHSARGDCAACGWSKFDRNVDRSNFNHSRIVHGSIYGLDIAEMAFDLEQFQIETKSNPPKPTKADLEALNAILEVVRDVQRRLAPDGRAHRAEVDKGIAKIIKSDKNERDHLFDALGFAGILHDPAHVTYRTRWIPPAERENRDSANGDTEYPVSCWRAIHGIDVDAQREWFPQQGIEVVAVAPPAIQKGIPKELKSLHPVLAEALTAMRQRIAPPYHAGGPAPIVAPERLAAIAASWVPLIKPYVNETNKSFFSDGEKAIAGAKHERHLSYWLKGQLTSPPVTTLGYILDLVGQKAKLPNRSGASAVRRVVQLLDANGADTAKFVRALDEALMLAELDRPGAKQILHRAKGLTLARLDGKNRFGVLAGGTWTAGSRDEILASIPDDQFAAGVQAALNAGG